MIVVDGTLKWRLGFWLLTTVGILGTFLLIEAYTSAKRAADRAFDSQLEAASAVIAEAIQWQDGYPVVEIPAAALQILATDQQERVFYTLLDSEGREVTGNLPSLINTSLRQAARQQPVLRSLYYRGASIRVYGRELKTAGWESLEPVQIWVGHTQAGRQALARDLFIHALSRFVAMVILTSLLMWLAIRTALTPVRRLRALIRERTSADVSPLNAKVPGELYDMAETLNVLFERQRQGRDALLRFTADASHQLKTPLAGLQSTSELALLSEHPDDWRRALQRVHDSSARTSRLASQLLSLARLRHAEDAGLSRLDLVSLLRETVMAWAERDVARRHQLGLRELPTEPWYINAEPWSLRELLGNLIDNALRYTPDGSEILLGLSREHDHLVLSVQDNGPGVSSDQLARLHQPFERGGRQDTEGSGLGLAIVDSIAQRHNAVLELRSEPGAGLAVRIRFALLGGALQ